MLVRREIFDRHGLLDEELTALHEHTDLCLTVRESGGKIVLEPSAVVTFPLDETPHISDLPYFMYRWSKELVEGSERHFHRKWSVEFQDIATRAFVVPHRRQAWSRLRRHMHALVGWRIGTFICDRAEAPFAWVGRRRHRRGRSFSRSSAGLGQS